MSATVHPHTTGWNIGYRLKKAPGYNPWKTPYTEASWVAVGDTPLISKFMAEQIYRQLSTDFPDAEWRLLEVRMTPDRSERTVSILGVSL